MTHRKKWPYIVGSIALIGTSWYLRRKAMQMRHEAEMADQGMMTDTIQ